jgi:hypothetical protein
MSDHDLATFEQELQALKPSHPPREFSDRVARAVASEIRTAETEVLASAPNAAGGMSLVGFLNQFRFHLRWMAPVAVLVLQSDLLGLKDPTRGATAPPAPGMKADDVKVDSTLVSSFDAVASLSDGEPVRFRCEEWLDEVQLMDTSRGLVYSQKVPRVTVVPVCFETY